MATEVVPGGPLQVAERRGYYKDFETGERYTRVSTVINILDKGLEYWSAGRVARAAFEHLPKLNKASMDEKEAEAAAKWLAGVPHREKQYRADLGTAVHRAIEAHILGVPAPQPVTADPDIAACIEHFERFVDEWQVTFVASEMTVLSRTHGYAGTLDDLMLSPLLAEALGTDPDLPIMGDTKTGGELDLKGVYPQVGLQMAGYGHAEFAQLRSGERVRMPKVAAQGVALHLRPGGYRPLRIDAGAAVFAQFLDILGVHRGWTTGIAKRVIGKQPLTLPEAGAR